MVGFALIAPPSKRREERVMGDDFTKQPELTAKDVGREIDNILESFSVNRRREWGQAHAKMLAEKEIIKFLDTERREM